MHSRLRHGAERSLTAKKVSDTPERRNALRKGGGAGAVTRRRVRSTAGVRRFDVIVGDTDHKDVWDSRRAFAEDLSLRSPMNRAPLTLDSSRRISA
jgi:hypothetical protein